jgi:hypothetical protein
VIAHVFDMGAHTRQTQEMNPVKGRTAPPGIGGAREVRSDYGSLPGGELPAAVYRSVIAAFGAIIVIAWFAFGGSADSDLALGFATVLTVVFFALPIIVRRTAAARSSESSISLDQFLRARVDTATGPLDGGQAWLQILIIPLALTFAAVVIGLAYVIVA